MKIREIIDLLENINEAPISDFNLIGDFEKNSSFRHAQDRKILTSPKAVEKIKKKWAKTDDDFNMMFVNSPEANRHTEVGEVSKDWLLKNMPKAYPQMELSDDKINIIFTNNKGDERAPMTAWIIAHRFGHALQRSQITDYKEAMKNIDNTFYQVLQEYGIKKQYGYHVGYSKLMRSFCTAIGTMKAARDKNLRNDFEFKHELLSQYIITGTIKFNKIPMSLGVFRGPQYRFKGDQDDMEECNGLLDTFGSDLERYYFPGVLSACVGRIFVM
jgi:hypothetical protein